MRQLVIVKTIAPANRFQFRIISIHEVNHQLIVVSELVVSDIINYDSIDYPVRVEYVETSVNHELEVIHYLLDESTKNDDKHLSKFGRRHFDNDTLTTFKPITASEQISELVKGGVLLYQCRPDGLIALRLQDNHQDKLVLPEPEFKHCGFDIAKLNNILNIYLVNHHDHMRIVFESIQLQKKDMTPLDLISKFSIACRILKVDFAALKDFLFMMVDDVFCFDALIGGDRVRMRTDAIMFTLPTDDENRCVFMRVVDSVLGLLQPPEFMQEANLCDVLQVSEQSVLSCFTDFSATPVADKLDLAYSVNQAAPLKLVEFLNKPGTQHFLQDIPEFIMQCLNGHREKIFENSCEVFIDMTSLNEVDHALFFKPAVSPRDILKQDNHRVLEVVEPENEARSSCLKRCLIL